MTDHYRKDHRWGPCEACKGRGGFEGTQSSYGYDVPADTDCYVCAGTGHVGSPSEPPAFEVVFADKLAQDVCNFVEGWYYKLEIVSPWRGPFPTDKAAAFAARCELWGCSIEETDDGCGNAAYYVAWKDADGDETFPTPDDALASAIDAQRPPAGTEEA